MPNVTLVLVWGMACGGGGEPVAPVAPVPGGLAQRRELPAPTMPSCPTDSNLEVVETDAGAEQYCDRDGVLHGPYFSYYPDGTHKSRGAYDLGEPNGDWFWWHDNGNEQQQGRYVRGKKTGSWSAWHSNGNRAEEGDYLQGRKAGKWVSWFSSGARSEEGMYHNGMKDGSWTYYNDDVEGTVERTERWENGVLAEEHKTKPTPAVRPLRPPSP